MRHHSRFASENSSTTETSSSMTGKKNWSHRTASHLSFGQLWPTDLKLPFVTMHSNKHKHPDEFSTDQSSDTVYTTLKEAASRGRTASMSSDGARHRPGGPRRGRPRRRCTSEPPPMNKYSSVGFSSAVDSILLNHGHVVNTQSKVSGEKVAPS